MLRCHRVLVLALTTAFAGCAAITCTPATIVVTKKDERIRIVTESRGSRTDSQGRIHEDRREVPVPDYWVQDGEGHWYRVGRTEFEAAEPGKPTQVCR